MSKDELDFEFTVKELDQMVLDAARGEGQNQAKKPVALEALKAKARLHNERTIRSD